jgi:hypothetical protein
MPIYEYLSSDGVRHERIYLVGKDAPSIILVDGEECPKVASLPVIKFKGPFSGGTTGKNIVHKDDGSVVEPGTREDTQRKRAEKDANAEAARVKHIENSLAEYSL